MSRIVSPVWRRAPTPYLVKPFNTEELQLQIRKLLEQRRILREKYARQMQVETCPLKSY